MRLKLAQSSPLARLALIGCLTCLPLAARGESLKDALTAAYLFNPTLKAARSQLRATDNSVSQAKSGYRPRVTGTLSDTFEDTRTQLKNRGGSANLGTVDVTPPGGGAPVATPLSALGSATGGGGSFSSNGTYNPRVASIALSQNVFDGFRTYNAVKGAEAGVEAGREDLRATEQSLLLNATTSYVNVVRDQAIVSLRQNNVRVVSEQLRAAQDRFKVGEVTRTVVSQAQASQAQTQADLAIAQATLSTNRAEYVRLIGRAPGTLRDPGPATKLLPKSLPSALALGQAESPLIISAIFRERAQSHTVKQIKGELLPSVTLNASYSKSYETSPSINQIDDAKITGNVNIPIYEAGEVSARIRIAIETQSQRRQQIDEQREQVRANVSAAWGQYLSSQETVRAGKSAVESSRVALQAIREENRVGQQTILDVLNSEQTLLNTQVNLVSFQRDLVVASYSVLSAIGRLSAYDIALQAELYDPNRNYDEVKDKWYGWGASIETAEDPHVARVRDSGLGAGQRRNDGPAYTQKLPSVP